MSEPRYDPIEAIRDLENAVGRRSDAFWRITRLACFPSVYEVELSTYAGEPKWVERAYHWQDAVRALMRKWKAHRRYMEEAMGQTREKWESSLDDGLVSTPDPAEQEDRK